ncbi:MAG: hypothetical protein JWM53_3020 [bacterium]|nr:hypothetical protein [bacterium]
MAVAIATAMLGTAGTIFAPKGSALSSLSSSVAGLGTGMAVIDMLQRPPHPPAQAQQQPRQADGEYVTREDLNEALRREMMRHHEQVVGAMRDELRNAAASYAMPSPQAYAPARPSWMDAPELPEERNNEPIMEAWRYASEPQAA